MDRGMIPKPISDLKNCEFTHAFFHSIGHPTPTVGDHWNLRFRYTKGGVPQNLTGAKITWTIEPPTKEGAPEVNLVRSSSVDISGGVKEIGIDDQTSVVLDGNNNPIGGTGYFELRMRSLAGEVTKFDPYAGLCPFAITIQISTIEIDFARGVWELLRKMAVRPIP
jgi:hypothetical protein